MTHDLAQGAKMKYFVDHHFLVRAICALNGFGSVQRIVESQDSTCLELTVVRWLFREVLAGRATIVYSAQTLETLRRVLVTGGGGCFDPLSADAALECVNALWSLADAGHGCVTEEDRRQYEAQATKLTAMNYGPDGGHDHEDDLVVSSLLAARSEDENVVLLTNDTGLGACARDLTVAGIAVLSAQRWSKSIGRLVAA